MLFPTAEFPSVKDQLFQGLDFRLGVRRPAAAASPQLSTGEYCGGDCARNLLFRLIDIGFLSLCWWLAGVPLT